MQRNNLYIVWFSLLLMLAFVIGCDPGTDIKSARIDGDELDVRIQHGTVFGRIDYVYLCNASTLVQTSQVYSDKAAYEQALLKQNVNIIDVRHLLARHSETAVFSLKEIAVDLQQEYWLIGAGVHYNNCFEPKHYKNVSKQLHRYKKHVDRK